MTCLLCTFFLAFPTTIFIAYKKIKEHQVYNQVCNQVYKCYYLYEEINSWLDVALRFERLSHETKSDGSVVQLNTPEALESFADSLRYQGLHHKKEKNFKTAREFYKEAANAYRKSYEKYIQASKAHVGSYGKKINAALGGKQKALSVLCEKLSETNDIELGPNEEVKIAWEELVGCKESYDLYARAEAGIFDSSLSAEKKAELWASLKNDTYLRDSFSQKSFEAFLAFAKIRRILILYKAEKDEIRKLKLKEELKNACKICVVKDLSCEGEIYVAFAAEAIMIEKENS